MKLKSKIMDILLYPTVIIVGFFIRILPVGVSLWIARRIGFLAYIFYSKRRNIGYANIKAAFCERLKPHEIKKITRTTFQHFAQVLFELFRFPMIDKKYTDRYIAFEGLEYISDALKKKRGAIIITAHFGNWELSGVAGAIKGYPQVVLARQQNYPRLNGLLNSYRELHGSRVVEKGMATREIISSLKNNEVVAILSDQDGGPNGYLVNFFGRLASTPGGAAVFTLKFGSLFLPSFCARQKGPFYHMSVDEPITLEKSGNQDADIQKYMQKFTNVLESYIIKYPTQWLWLHKRWKTTPSRRILILSDGKAGHLNQARAVAKEIKNVVFEKADSDSRVKLLENIIGKPESEKLIYLENIKEVKYKTPLHKAVLTICSLFASNKCQGCMRCVEFCLTAESYKNLMAVYADIVISCGSSLGPVNRFLCKENRAKGIVVTRPGILPLSKFDLAVLPKHDNSKKSAKVLVVDGAPNLIDQAYLKKESQDLLNNIGLTEEHIAGKIKIGIFIGGENKDFVLEADVLSKILDDIIKFSHDRGALIFATTSRRTSKAIEILMKEKLGRLLECKLLVVANEKNIPQAVGGIMGLSDIIIVSGESISMVSEAASAAKKVIVFKPQLRNKTNLSGPRHLKFLDNLKRNEFIVLCEPNDMLDAICLASQKDEPVKKLNDNKLIYEAVKKIV